jgi:hypothetical protein
MRLGVVDDLEHDGDERVEAPARLDSFAGLPWIAHSRLDRQC